MADCMMFPKDWHDFIKDYSFIDSERVYTNGSELIQVLRVTQLIEHLLNEQEAVVRCKDCKFMYEDDVFQCGIKAGYFPVNEDWFCADGERKENA